MKPKPEKPLPWLMALIPPKLDTPAFRQAWTDWHEQRRELKRKPYTRIGCKYLLDRLNEWGEARAVKAIAFSISQQYQGIFEDRSFTNGKAPMNLTTAEERRQQTKKLVQALPPPMSQDLIRKYSRGM